MFLTNKIKMLSYSILVLSLSFNQLNANELDFKYINNIQTKNVNDKFLSTNSILSKLDNILNDSKLTIKEKNEYINEMIVISKNFENKFDISKLDYPNVKSMQEQINVILNSNLKELGSTKSMKLYLTLNKNLKNRIFDITHRELVLNVEKEISTIINNYNLHVFVINNTAINITKDNNKYNVEEIDSDEPLTSNTKEVNTKNIDEKLIFLNNSIKSNNVLDFVDILISEKLNIFSINEKEILKSYSIVNSTLNYLQSTSLDKTNLDYLISIHNSLKEESLQKLIYALEYEGYDLSNLNDLETVLER